MKVTLEYIKLISRISAQKPFLSVHCTRCPRM